MNCEGSETPVPDDDPIDCQGHGTHVAGIIGASNDDLVLGVAPAATLGIYKVFGCTGQVANDVLIEAFTMAYNAGADIITASIGGASGWPEEYVIQTTVISQHTYKILGHGPSQPRKLLL